MGYLDNAGLTYFWSKVKAALSGKQDKLTAGPGIKIEGNIVSTIEEFPAWIGTVLPSSVDWISVAYGNGKFVSIARNSNKAAYSTDGITWTETALPSSGAWQCVSYGGGKFIAVEAVGNKAAYSTDGITWTELSMPSSEAWRSVAYGNGKFVAIAYNSNKSAYSTDGITWAETALPFSGAWISVAYGGGKFVAVATGNKSAYSTDGITWTETALPSSVDWISVAYGGGKFVSVARNSNKAAYAAFTNVTFEALNDELAEKGDNLALTGQTLSLKSGDDVLSSVELPAGVTSFNGRYGAVTPQAGDYTAEMVGAATAAYVDDAIRLRARIETGTYIGTGQSGADHPNSLTFSFPPTIVMFVGRRHKATNNSVAFLENFSVNSAFVIDMADLSTSYMQDGPYKSLIDGAYTRAYAYAKRSSNGRTLFWYIEERDSSDNSVITTDRSYEQYNTAGEEYRYVAIG